MTTKNLSINRKREIDDACLSETKKLWGNLEVMLAGVGEPIYWSAKFLKWVDTTVMSVDEIVALSKSDIFAQFINRVRSDGRFVISPALNGLKFSTPTIASRTTEQSILLARNMFDVAESYLFSFKNLCLRLENRDLPPWPTLDFVARLYPQFGEFFKLCREHGLVVCRSFSHGLIVGYRHLIERNLFNSKSFISPPKISVESESVAQLSKEDLFAMRQIQDDLDAGENKMYVWDQEEPNINVEIDKIPNNSSALRMLCCDIDNDIILTRHGFVLVRATRICRQLEFTFDFFQKQAAVMGEMKVAVDMFIRKGLRKEFDNRVDNIATKHNCDRRLLVKFVRDASKCRYIDPKSHRLLKTWLNSQS
jgi:hypothetical protein